MSDDCLIVKLQGNYSANKVAIADLNGDGIYDYVIKQPGWSIDPGRQQRSRDTYKVEAYDGKTGAFLWRHDLGWNINMGIWFSPMTVYDLDGDGKAEVAVKTGPPAATPEEAFISEGGFVLAGPEYCSILDGLTGEEVTRTDWVARGDPTEWGDDKGNRVNRNQIGVAYLDGRRPSLLVLRGTYTKMRVDAYNYAEKKLEKLWSWCGDDETPPLRGQGAHSLHAFDIDDDGRDEIIIGSAALDDDGTCLWRMNMGHPDWCYLADVDPNRPGLELAYGFETAQQRDGICLADPRTGTILWGCDHPTTHIHDWGMVADIDPAHRGMEIYGMERDGRTCWLYSAQGKLLDERRRPWPARSARVLLARRGGQGARAVQLSARNVPHSEIQGRRTDRADRRTAFGDCRLSGRLARGGCHESAGRVADLHDECPEREPAGVLDAGPFVSDGRGGAGDGVLLSAADRRQAPARLRGSDFA